MLAFQTLTQTPEPETVNLNGPLSLILLFGVILSVPISASLIWLYRRAVRKSMRARVTPPTAEEPDTARPSQSTEPLPKLASVDRPAASLMTPAAIALFAEVRRARWRVAAVYIVAGVCFAGIMTTASLTANDLEFFPLRVLVQFWIDVWPLVLTVNLIANTSRLAKLTTAIGYFVAFAIIMIAVTAGSTAPIWSAPVAWLLFNLPGTLLLLGFLNRRVRAVGPLVLIFLIVALAGPQVIIFMAASDDRVLRLLVTLGQPLGLGGTHVLIVLVLFGFLCAGPIGWLTLKWIRRRYERKKISDETITLDAIWLLFGFIQSLMLASQGVVWLLSGFVAFFAYKIIAWLGFSLIKASDPTKANVRLLLLRVFSLGKRSGQLFGALEKHWRHVGSIQLIAGTDLATDNLEPHEFLDFLSARLARRFIDAPATLRLRISEMDLGPDQDGRFRVNEFFSHDDTWKHVLDRLVSESDAVLMDLRGFTPQNAGCIYEIAELINVVSLARVQFVIDQTTNEPFLLQCLQESWHSMKPGSPNRTNAAEVRLFRFAGSGLGELSELLRSLCLAAKAA